MKMKKFEFWFGRENADESSQERQEETKHPLLSVDTHTHTRARSNTHYINTDLLSECSCFPLIGTKIKRAVAKMTYCSHTPRR